MSEEKKILVTAGGEQFTQRFVESVDFSRCVGCGSCVFACPKNVFGMKLDSEHIAATAIQKDACVGCTTCLRVCPTKAVLLRTVERSSLSVTDSEGYSIGHTFSGAPFRQSFVSRVVEEECLGCGLCAKVCSRNCYEITLKGARLVAEPVKAELCIGDGACTRVCPTKAIH